MNKATMNICVCFCVNIKFLYLLGKYLGIILLSHLVSVYLIVGKILVSKGYLYNLKVFLSQNNYYKREERLKENKDHENYMPCGIWTLKNIIGSISEIRMRLVD